MYPAVLSSIVELVCNDSFTVTVGEEIDGACWDYANERRP